MTNRFRRLAAFAAGGDKLCGRQQANPSLSRDEAMNVNLFGRLLSKRFGPPDQGGDADYYYSIEDTSSGYTFGAYSGNSGPSYAGVTPESVIDFDKEDYRIRPEILQILSDFEQWLTLPAQP